MNLRRTQIFAEGLARQAGALLLRKFGKAKIVRKKAGNDFALDADLASERLILRELKKFSPTIPVLAEESSSQSPKSKKVTIDGQEFTWVVDPLDGTKNFFHRLPFWCVSIALLHKAKPVIGVIYLPITDELFSARLGGGTMSNGKKISVSQNTDMRDSLVVVEIPRPHASGRNFQKDVRNFTSILNKVRRVRAFAAAAADLCLIARGAADAYLDFSRNTKIWDVSAGRLIVTEAGGHISDVTLPDAAKDSTSVLATNGKLHRKFLPFFT